MEQVLSGSMTASQEDKAPELEGDEHAPLSKRQKQRAREKASKQLQEATKAQAAVKEHTDKELEFLKMGKKMGKAKNDLRVQMSSGVSVDRAFVDDPVRLAIGIHAAFPQDESIFKNTLEEFDNTREYVILDTVANRHSTQSCEGVVSQFYGRHALNVDSETMYACLDTVC